jgi:hypothetical protein
MLNTHAEVTAAIVAHGEEEGRKAIAAKKAGDMPAAEVHYRRFLTATRTGRHLNTENEYRDPNYCMENQPLRTAAFKFGLVTDSPHVA